MKTISKYTILVTGLLAGALSSFGAGAKALTPAFVDTLVEPYLSIQGALAGDDLAAAQAGAQDFLSALNEGSQAESLQGLQSTAGSLAKAEDIAAARTAFLALSNGMIELVRQSGTGGEAHLYVVHCPMAFGGKGGDWLQSETTVANPYYGASMLRCGGISEELGQKQANPHPTQEPVLKDMPHAHAMLEKSGNGHPHARVDLDAIHAGVTGYASRSASSNESGSCQMDCCAAVN